MTSDPIFIHFSSVVTPSIRSFTEVVFGAEGSVCVVDSILVSNVYSEAIAFDLYVHRGVLVPVGACEGPVPEEKKRADQDFWLCRGYPLGGHSRLEVLGDHPLYLQPGQSFTDGTEWEGDMIYARSDALDHYLSCMVSYRVLSETSVGPGRI